MRPIDADALKKDLSHDGKPFHPMSLGGLLVKYIDNAQTLDVAPVAHGEWEWDEARCIYRCSKCKSPKAREDMDRSPVKEQSFCHNCGARMRKGEK